MTGFCQAVVISRSIRIDITTLFNINDYWNLGIKSIFYALPYLPAFFVSVLIDAIPTKRDISRWVGIIITVLLAVLSITSHEELFTFLLIILVICVQLDKYDMWDKAKMLFVFFFVIISVVSARTDIKNEISVSSNETSQDIQSASGIPAGSGYVFSTSRYHVFRNESERENILIPIDMTKNIIIKY